MTATVETMADQLDVAPMIPTENVMTALARSITVSDTDVGKSYHKTTPFNVYSSTAVKM